MIFYCFIGLTILTIGYVYLRKKGILKSNKVEAVVTEKISNSVVQRVANSQLAEAATIMSQGIPGMPLKIDDEVKRDMVEELRGVAMAEYGLIMRLQSTDLIKSEGYQCVKNAASKGFTATLRYIFERKLTPQEGRTAVKSKNYEALLLADENNHKEALTLMLTKINKNEVKKALKLIAEYRKQRGVPNTKPKAGTRKGQRR